MNKIKPLFDKKYYDLAMELSYTQTYRFLNVFIPFYLSIFLTILSQTETFFKI